MNKPKGNRSGGFTLIELLVVITIIAVLAGLAFPTYNKIRESSKITKDINNARQIVLACRAFAADWDGLYPSFDPDDQSGGGGGDDSTSIGTSTEAFNILIPTYVDTETIFWFAGNPTKPRPPREDGTLESTEVTYSYVAGQTDTTFSRSPLVADEMEGGAFGENHPWLKSKKAVVGFCGGQVEAMPLTSDQPGATARTKDGLIQDVFQPRAGGEEGGGGGGGLLAVDPSKVLNP